MHNIFSVLNELQVDEFHSNAFKRQQKMIKMLFLLH